MGFFFCPRLRRYQRASGSSDYQLDRFESLPSGHGAVEGNGISSSMDEHARSEHRSDSSGGLSSRIRRRFSRDAREIYRRPNRLERGPKSPFLHFASKPGVRSAQITSYDLGSTSLMSERGYDSDAQYIATPKHPTYATEYSAGRPRNGMAITPRRPPAPLREPDREFPREQAFGLTMDATSSANEQPPYHWEQIEPHQTWRSRDHEYRTQQFQEVPYTSFYNIDLGAPRGKQLSPSPSISKVRAQERPGQGPGLRTQEPHQPHTPVGLGRSVAPKSSFEDIVTQRPSHGYEAVGPGFSSHHVPQQQAYTTSAESLHGCPPQLSVRQRNQRPRKEMTPDEQSVHLGEMNIPRMLASSGSTSNLIARHPDFDEYQPGSNPGTWTANRYQGTNHAMVMAPIWDAPEGRSADDQDTRSPYSPKNSVSSAGLDYEHNVLGCLPNSPQKSAQVPLCHPGNSSRSEETQNSNPARSQESCIADENQGLTNRFIAKLESDRSTGVELDSHGENSAVSPRKTSIGWLSEGRRVGYGYTLVPPEHTSESNLPRSCESARDSPKGSKITEHELPDRQATQQTRKTSKGVSKTSESSFDISAILQRLNLPRWTGASFALRTSNNSDVGSCESGGSSLFGILPNKRKTHEQLEPHAEAENPWEFCSWVPPSQSLGEQQAAQRDRIRSHEHAEVQLIDKLATLRRRGGAWATKRKISEIARNIERRAVAKIAASTEQFPVVQRTATRVLRLKAPGGKDPLDKTHDDKPTFSASQVDGNEDLGDTAAAPRRQMSSTSSGDWDSLYEECLEERTIPE